MALTFTHVTGDVLKNVIGDLSTPSNMTDQNLVINYLKEGSSKGDPIYLGIGETWTEVAPGLVELAKKPWPTYLNGYLFSQYGLPKLQNVLRESIPQEHRFSKDCELGRDFEVAVSCQGTRNVMFDFGRMLMMEAPRGKTPVALVTSPGWDYPGVFGPLGFKMQWLPLRRENDFHPSMEDLEVLLKQIDAYSNEYLGLVVINAQQNPTGVNWRPEFVRKLIQIAIDRGAAVLADDAYYSILHPGTEATSTLGILTEELQKHHQDSGRSRQGIARGHERSDFPVIPWMGVRSLGKQFNCNGWGIGAMVSHPVILERMIHQLLLSRTYIYSGMLQYTMADWLTSSESKIYLEEKNQEFKEKREQVGHDLETLLGYPKNGYFAGTCTSYLLFQAPASRARKMGNFADVEKYRTELFFKTGVLFSQCNLNCSITGDPVFFEMNKPHFRIFLAPRKEALREAIERLHDAGVRWEG